MSEQPVATVVQERTTPSLPDYVWSGSVVLLCLGGYVSTSPLVPVPLHYLGAAGTALGVLVHALRGHWPRGLDLIIILWVIFVLGLLVQAPATAEAGQTRSLLFSVTLLSALGGAFLLNTAMRVRALSILLLAMSAAYGVMAIAFPQNGYRLSLVGTGYIASGRIISVGLVVLLAWLLITRIRLWLLPAIPIALLLAFETQTRGPLMAAIAAPLVMWLFAHQKVHAMLRFLVVVLILAAGVIGIQSTSLFQDSRFAGIAQGDASVTARLELFQTALSLGLSHPLGVGWGNFGIYDPQKQAYPHNVLLEVWAEAGWLAAVATIAVLTVSVRGIFRSRSPELVVLGCLLFYALFNAMVSDDINGNRFLWVLVFAAIAYARNSDVVAEDDSEAATRAP